MRVELVCDEEPRRCGVGVNRLFDVSDEVDLGPSRADRGVDDLPGDDVEVRHQAQGAVAQVLELHALHETGADGFGLMEPLERLHARLLVGADDVSALGRQLRCALVGVADLLHDGHPAVLGRLASQRADRSHLLGAELGWRSAAWIV